MTQFYLPNAQATHELGKKLGRSLPANSVLLLQGNLGAGKTTFVQGLAAG
ncbi:MAG TPA: bifunctional alanine racemase/tRNA (adenosine(37)-N6)-threonylcarbamoyltransferase complex ATPase subunit type 1 TsaE, partial [Planktothrix sp. UBA10369]|nr:bifunctional alanine racemase/tRNA (adenosine(37)-N6)-threonylcarbamoyltransferase complex ATPase subunit type 1 TsaE [Planktothrix sp. UBA10369]